MVVLSIRHKTVYRFGGQVSLNPHRLLLRPREGRDLRLLSNLIHLTPLCELTWAQDVFGNSVATANFTGSTDSLVVESLSEVELTSAAWPVFPVSASAISYPFLYTDEEWMDLGALVRPQYHDAEDAVRNWARSFVLGSPTDTLSLLKDLNQGVTQRLRYEAREAEGTQSPDETLQLGIGTCRDMATLLVEAARLLGFGGRIASGYLYDPDMSRVGSVGSGSTHAWAEIYVPGAGWITFDPTNQSVGGHNLIPVAVARDIRQVTPVSGSYAGASSATEMTVDVSVSALA
ncbi:transglutaminase family protein [Bradyrhizobium sp. SSUT18]|uniref:transglutaminase family protein n=1 Tax=unclassified Bradyrhizobium TaxID=2631580 RepID=UPI00244C7E6E|nr:MULTISPECIES: transglutaminase family protein [unclassified Bradyrhizobium]MDH2353063.1 transglutaminase family protein [Bradyrhizobium sp. SSUT112]MDH2398567.1 transglutaminase family protein [Bradyrhizobium sp. SSUT18]